MSSEFKPFVRLLNCPRRSLLTRAHLCYRWKIWGLLSIVWDQLWLWLHSYILKIRRKEVSSMRLLARQPTVNYACWGLTAVTAPSFKAYATAFRHTRSVNLPLLRVRMKSNTHTWNDFVLERWVNLELGPSLVSVAVGVSLLAPGLMSLRTPKLRFLDSWWTTYKRQESCSKMPDRRKKWI